MPRTPTIKSLKNKADRKWAESVKRNAKGRCERCGKYEGVQSHHVVGRQNHALRFDVRNGVALCWYDHYVFAHQHPLDFAEWFREHRPADYAYVMDPENRKPVKRTIQDYMDLNEELAA